jgi:hypothetical protein
MKNILQISFFLLFAFSLHGQIDVVVEIGTVSFVSSRNVYVKFNSTENINVGDTLFVNNNGNLLPELVIDNKSSSSTVCSRLGEQDFKAGDEISARTIIKKEVVIVPEEEKDGPFPKTEEEPIIDRPVAPTPESEDEEVLFKEKIKGRISAASYSNFSDNKTSHRMRYAFSFRGYNLKNSRFSTENYITFRHTLNDSVNILDALRIYSLSVKYDFDKSSSLTFGRKINRKISSMGAIDGLQYEKGFGNFRLGAIAGSRPNFQDYSFDPNLLQFGAYASHVSSDPGNYAITTLGVVQQMNKGNIDRRFMYFQHSSQLAKNLNLFGSFEVDFFENINNEINSSARLTNLYVSLRYRINKKWRVSASYDNRKNIIYYESYKDFIDRLIEDETRQGFRFGISHRPTRMISWGLNSSVRFQKSKANPSRNLNGYITISKVPFINARATIRANFLQTDFLDSQIFGARLSKELIRGKLNGEIYYRWVDYKYKIGDRVVHQNIGGASLNLRIQKNLSLYLYYEGVFDQSNQNYSRFNAKLIKRF